MKERKYLPMYLFGLLKDLAFFNNKALKIVYPSGYNSLEVLYEGSKDLPRKKKKALRKLIIKELRKLYN